MPGASQLYKDFTLTIRHESGTPGTFQSGWFAHEDATTLTEAWNQSVSTILFLKTAPADEAAFTKKLEAFLLDPARSSLRILWIENPDDRLSKWRSYSLSATGTGSQKTVSELTYIDFKNYSLGISKNSQIELKDDEFVITREANNAEGFEWNVLAAAKSRSLILLMDDYAKALKEAQQILADKKEANAPQQEIDDAHQEVNRLQGFAWIGDFRRHNSHRIFNLKPSINIPSSGGLTGCLQFEIHIEREDFHEGFGYPDLMAIDVGMRIFFRDPDFPNDPDTFYLSFNKYPLFQERSSNLLAKSEYPVRISLEATLDPVFPMEEDRSFFNIGARGPNGIPSAYFTNYGFDVHLLPKVGESQLVFAKKPDLLDAGVMANAPYYLAPKGNFEMRVPRYSGGDIDPASMDCGISGLEYINISAGSEIEFVTGRAAYSGAFLSIRSLLRDFNTIQKQFQRNAGEEGALLKDLPETTDLDIEVEATDGLNISDDDRSDMLDFVMANYFPDNFTITDKQRKFHLEIKIVEDWIQSYRDLLKEATIALGKTGSLLNDQIKTSWVYVRGSSSAAYYAQPDNAVLHLAEASSTQFLDYMEVPTLGLPLTAKSPQKLTELTGSSALAFPMMPYGNVDPYAITDIRQMEMLVLNPVRRKTLQHIGESDIDTSGTAPVSFSTPLPLGSTVNRLGTTPQGLISKYSQDWKTIEQLRLAKDTANKNIGFANIEHGSPMKGAFQSNQLFLVISDPEAVLKYFSNATLADFNKGFQSLPIEERLKKELENDLEILEWIFELGPGFWDIQGTIMVFKYTNTSLFEMAAQPENWFMADTFNSNPKKTSEKLQQLLSDAMEFGKSDDPKERRKYASLAVAASQPNWTGILMLNVHVPLRGLPDSLKALAGGMNPDLFYANFVGVEVTQVKAKEETHGGKKETVLDPQQSSLFALIDYKNPATPRAEASGFNFHVPFLSIVFENSHIVHFAAEVLLIMDKLFDERAKLLNSRKNIIALKGVAEEHNGRVTYSFGFSGENRFKLSGKVLDEVEIIKAQFSTDPLPPKEIRGNILHITGRFSLWGQIRFAYLREFDILSFGRLPKDEPKGILTPASKNPPPDYLNASNLEVTLDFDLDQASNKVTNRRFTFNPNKLAFDLVKSGWRNQSLYEKFPLTFRGFTNVKTRLAPGEVAKTGYMPVSVPIKRVKLGENYYQIKFDLKLGSLGALSGSKPLGAEILVAWNPEQAGLFVGLKLAGSTSEKKEITLQGLLKLSFGSIRFVVFDKDKIPEDETEVQRIEREKEERQVGYLLNLKNIKLKFFLLTFPPIGQTEMTLFGDPREGVLRVDRLVGWYASYVKK